MSEISKRCDHCEVVHSMQDLVCDDCEFVFEEWSYVLWLLASAALAWISVWLLARWDVLIEFQVRDWLSVAIAYMVLLYGGAKLVQRVVTPNRPVLSEIGSVFAGRWDRAFLLYIHGYALIMLAQTWGCVGNNFADASNGPYWAALVWFNAIVLTGVVVAVVRDQGASFFDPRVRNTYVARSVANR